MLEQRSLKSDLAALALLALTIFLGAALVTYDPADSASALVYPRPAESHNACGRTGALVADVALGALGLGAYYVVLSLAVVDVLLFGRRKLNEPFLRGFGWSLSLVGLTTLSAMTIGEFSTGPVIGPGGYLGAMGHRLLEGNFAAAGAYLLTVSVIVGGLLLCTDYALLRGSAWIVRVSAGGLGRPCGRALRVWAARRRHGRTITSRRGTSDIDEPHGVVARARVKTIDHAPNEISGAASERTTGSTPKSADDAAANAESSNVTSRLAAALGFKGGSTAERRRQFMLDEIEAESHHDATGDYDLPDVDLLLAGEPLPRHEHEQDVRHKASLIEKTFASFGFSVKVVAVETGPVIAQFEVELEAGLRLAKITSLADDLAIAMRVPSVRIVAPIPGKNTVGIEVPNAERQLVRLRDVMEEAASKAQKMRIPIFLAKDVAGDAMVVDLATLPHLLIAGRTGTGKSVCLNTIIMSILMTRRPDEVRLLLIDPKMVELSAYMRLPHLMHPVVTDMKKAEAILAWAVEKMEERYALLARAGVRHISVYNQLGEEELRERLQVDGDDEDGGNATGVPTHLPYIVIVADEMADLMMTAAKEVEGHIIRLAQKSRAVGIHLVLATQKPTVDVITGLIKSNLPARISFQVASRTDSRVVLDEMGADKLLGDGDLLFLWPGTSTLLRGQGAFVSDDEINAVVDTVATGEPQFVSELVQLRPRTGPDGKLVALAHRDELYESAVDLIVREGRGSVSLLQRGLGIGYGRAARLIDYMAEDGIVGQYNGSQAREVLVTLEQWSAMNGQPAANNTLVSRGRRSAPPARLRIALHPETGDAVQPSDDQSDDGFDDEPPIGNDADENVDQSDDDIEDEVDDETVPRDELDGEPSDEEEDDDGMLDEDDEAEQEDGDGEDPLDETDDPIDGSKTAEEDEAGSRSVPRRPFTARREEQDTCQPRNRPLDRFPIRRPGR